MDTETYIYIALLLLLFFGSAFFSGAEVALFSFDKSRVKAVFSDSPLIRRYFIALLNNPRRLLVTILIGNNIVNVGASIIAVTLALKTAYLYDYSPDLMLTAEIILLTVMILLFGEITPKVFASKNPDKFSKLVVVPIYWVSVVIYPIAQTISEIIRAAFVSTKIDTKITAITDEEIQHLADIGHEKGTLGEGEHELIQSIVSYRNVIVREIMKPRVDITAVSTDTSLDEIFKMINDEGHSRLPLFREHIDEIVGIVYAKDLLPYLRDPFLKENVKLEEIARPAMYIPETKQISDLMREFQEKKLHLAIVVDEYGGTSGLVTLEDIIEEIIGDFRDEFDKEIDEVVQISETAYLFEGTVSVDEVNEMLDIELDTQNDDYDTLGGFIFNHAGDIPEEGYKFNLYGYNFKVKSIQNNRIQKILVEKNK